MDLDIEAKKTLTTQLRLSLKSRIQSIDTANTTLFIFDNC